MLRRLAVAFLFLFHLTNGQVESPSFPEEAPVAHALKPGSAGVDAPSSIEAALLANNKESKPEEESKPQEETPKVEERKANLINLDQFNLAEFEDTVESNKPDNVDNDAIQELIDQFLNKGTLEQDKNKKINTNVQKLINSSSYWDTSDLREKHTIKNAKAIEKWLDGYDEEAERVLQQVSSAAWQLFTSASPITKQYLNEAEDVARAFLKASAKQAMQFDPEATQDPTDRKQLDVIAKEGMNALDASDFNEYNHILGSINKIYTNVDVCETGKKVCIQKYSDLIGSIQTNTDPDEGLKMWRIWRASVGQNLTAIYEKLVRVTNKAAKLNGYENAGEMWRSAFDQVSTDKTQKGFDIAAEVEHVYTSIFPFYTQLHSYLRRQLAGNYRTDEYIGRDSPIPAHLLRSSTGDDWSANYDDTKPFDKMDKIEEEVADNLRKQNKNPRSMFAKVFRYMRYLDFEQLPDTFWTESVFSRIWSKDMICNPATAYDMINGTDYRIKICAQLTQPDFVMAHKLFAQLFYKYYSNDKPLVLRDAPNPTISSAVAGAFGILATNMDYLQSQHLISPDTLLEKSSQIDALYKEALSEIVRIPFALVSDKWRYKVFEGQLTPENWSKEWWSLREKYQGVEAPKDIKAAKFDAVVASEISQQHAPASRHIVQYVAQFQILKALCAGSKLPLSEACIADKNAVKKLISVMQKGGTISWLDALEEITGERMFYFNHKGLHAYLGKLDATPMLDYYEPLINWLSTTNEKDEVFFGWDGDGEKFKPEELPKARLENGNKPSIPSDDQIAYPGASCSRGQECLLESTCNGTVCVCNEGLYTLHIGDTYNCVPENPANAGFGDGSNIVISLTPNNQTKDDNSTVNANESGATETQPTDTLSTNKIRNLAVTTDTTPCLTLLALLSSLLIRFVV
ncbi:Angiotensin-converting enzyme [Aphelenchoides bicaudatus]|nr:Angiotensin-converting enzyme [Aphelenchoides bicaudatus]